ncbi:helix-turn-helix domain-containing protein [Rummeliibacillus sp. NPDC094406]|uniref:helix-turn-helix domain-containing protein n=1 Tax=Rummeliibacillus sp. NPDC094406 TaxID=3364511 RepID=UPI0038209556
MQNIGNIIKSERIKQHITQKALAQDICSTSYLSKIESGKQIPLDEVKNALLKRLSINLDHYIDVDEDQFMEDSYKVIKKVLLKNDPSLTKETIEYYKSMNLEFSNVENFYTFNIRLLRLFLMTDEPLDKITTLLNALTTMEENLNDHQKFFYYTNCYLYCLRSNKYKTGLSFLEKAGILMPNIQLTKWERAEYYFMLSSVYHKLYRTLNAIEYAQQAMKLYTELDYHQQMVNCYIRLGLSHIQNGHYNCALEIFDNCYNVCNKYNLEENYGIIFQNLGYIYALEGDSRGAISYYRKSLAVKKEPIRILITIHSMVKEYSKLNNATSVETWCKKGLQLIDDHRIEETAKEFVYHFNIYKIIHHLSDFDESFIASAINFFQQTQDYKNVYKYTTLLGNLLCEQNEYKKASHYFQRATEAMYAMHNIKVWEDLS